ncbi:uncharacterized protein SPSK_02560 [Sporothrix schenckii 1099-18]|uniref:Cytochrome b561 domain-containing protein n=2 Tax=Sporothrix schenckii TaxID=29908 RepID=U7PRD9_SPOS1|nr:uncharacterized protein SPSK_02560 [Sporothrix schenckii 1099-18]ERS97030.1 hypothetical protein HMPREF1624_06358 [Sporothrix schenckii ATCC 58251]KJR86229.1 integral membrane protein [Sporothrix schenckii 1099-18]
MSLATRSRWALVASLLAVATAAVATATADADSPIDLQQHYGPFGGNGPFGSNGPFGGNGNGNGNGNANGNGFPGLFGINLREAIHYRTIHGILASLSIVVLFPVGSILMRVVPGRFAIWAHGVFQMLAFLLFVAAAALGIYLVKTVTIPFTGASLLANPSTNIHPIMGIVTLATLFFQPILGFVHHAKFKQLGRRTFWSYMHLWNGRIGITVGIVNGGLGLRLANARRTLVVAYIVVAVIVWFFWFVVAVISEIRRARQSKRAGAAVGPAAGASRGGTPYRGDGPGYYAARAPGHGSRMGRSRSPGLSLGPEMTAHRNISTAGTGAAPGSRHPSHASHSGQHSPKVRSSHSSSGGSVSPLRR